MRALTVRRPWAYAIIYLGKDVENRSWWTSYRGPLLIHAAGSAPRHDLLVPVKYSELVRGAITGVVELYDCVRDAKSEWAERGQWHWLLRDPRPLEPIRCQGALGLWRPTAAQVPDSH